LSKSTDAGRLYTERPRLTTTATVFLLPALENAGKMDIQLDANVENQDRAKCGKNEAGWMKSFVCRVRKHVGNRAADDRPDDAERDCPENRHVHVHH
jgi:hypothetical protein